jgi:hypothetical protein
VLVHTIHKSVMLSHNQPTILFLHHKTQKCSQTRKVTRSIYLGIHLLQEIGVCLIGIALFFGGLGVLMFFDGVGFKFTFCDSPQFKGLLSVANVNFVFAESDAKLLRSWFFFQE